MKNEPMDYMEKWSNKWFNGAKTEKFDAAR